MNNFNRLLLLLSNEVMIKSRDVVGPKVLSDPEMVCCTYMYACIIFMLILFLCEHIRIYAHKYFSHNLPRYRKVVVKGENE